MQKTLKKKLCILRKTTKINTTNNGKMQLRLEIQSVEYTNHDLSKLPRSMTRRFVTALYVIGGTKTGPKVRQRISDAPMVRCAASSLRSFTNIFMTLPVDIVTQRSATH